MPTLRELELTAGQIVGEDLDGAILIVAGVSIPCTHSPMVKDMELISGESARGVVQACQFRTASVEGLLTDAQLKKGQKCTLVPFPGSPEYPMQLWSGGMLSGGEIYQFELRDATWGV